MGGFSLVQSAKATSLSLEKLNQGWQHNPTTLEAFFEVCVRNWKEWGGKRPAAVVAQINGTYLQATQGDYVDESHKSVEHAQRDEMPSYQEWKRIKGMPRETAKRRLITLLRSIDARLLNVRAQPVGYLLQTREGRPICPWANSVRGCPMPLLDTDGTPLPQVIDRDIETLKTEAGFRRWIAAHEEHACYLGIHVPLLSLAVRPYLTWFNQKIVGGFKPYDFTGYRQLVKSAVDKQAAHYQHLMDTSRQHKYTDVERELEALVAMMRVYQAYTDEAYVYEVTCTRNDSHCNQRRATDRGLNHKHPLLLSMAGGTFSSEAYERVAQVRDECRAVGLSVQTGVTRDLEQRHRILSERLANFKKQKAAAAAARERLERMVHRNLVKTLIPAAASRRINESLTAAITEGHMDTLPRAIHLGADPNGENSAGTTALIRAVLSNDVALIKRLVTELRVPIDHMNRFGMSAMSWACKRGEPIVIETLLDLGADVSQDGGGRYTPFMHAVRGNRSEVVDMLLDYLLRDARFGSRGVDRALNTQVRFDGASALMVAARHRIFGMVRQLLRRNANRYLRDQAGLTAEGHARRAGWLPIAEFLATTKAAGPTGMYTFQDEQSERDIRDATSSLVERLREHGAGTAPTEASEEPRLSIMAGEGPTAAGQVPKRGSGGHVVAVAGSSSEAVVEAGKGHGSKGKRASGGEVVAAGGGREAVGETTRGKAHREAEPADLPFPIPLLRGGLVPPDSETSDGSTSLLCAAFKGDLVLARLLLKEGAAVDYDNRFGKTPLIAAATGGSYDMVVELLERGADVKREDTEGRSATAYAEEAGHYDLAAFLGLVGAVGVKEALRRRRDEALRREAAAEEEARTRRLLEEYGLTPKQRAEADLTSWTWRLGKANVDMRCWKCTLPVPCRHFKDKASLKASVPYPEKQWQWHHQPRGWRRQRRLELNARVEQERQRKALEDAEAEAKRPKWLLKKNPSSSTATPPRTPTARTPPSRGGGSRGATATPPRSPPLSPGPKPKTPITPPRSSGAHGHKQEGEQRPATAAEGGRPTSPCPVRPPTGTRAASPSRPASSRSPDTTTRRSSAGRVTAELSETKGQSVKFIDGAVRSPSREQARPATASSATAASSPKAQQQGSQAQAEAAGPSGETTRANQAGSATDPTLPFFAGPVPVRIRYRNVRKLLAPSVRRDFNTTMPAQFLMRLGLSDALLPRLFGHGDSAQDRDNVQREDDKIMAIRSIRSPAAREDAGRRGRGRQHPEVRAFLTVAVRYGMCVFERCARCAIGYAKLRSKGLQSRSLCDLCVLLRVTRPRATQQLADMEEDRPGTADEDGGGNGLQGPATLSRLRPMTIPDALQATLSCLPDGHDVSHLTHAGGVGEEPIVQAARPSSPSPLTGRSVSIAEAAGETGSFRDTQHAALSGTATRRSSTSKTTGSHHLAHGAGADEEAVVSLAKTARPSSPSPLTGRSVLIAQTAPAAATERGSFRDTQSAALTVAATRRSSTSKKKVSKLMQSLRDEMLGSLPLTRRASLSFATAADLAQVGRASQKLYEAEPGVYHRSRNLDLADFLLSKGKAAEAEGLLLKTLQDHVETFGRTHVSIALILRSLGQVEELRGMLPLSRAYRETSFELLSTMFGPTHRETFRAANLLARSLALQERFDDAIFFYRQMAEQLRATRNHGFWDQADLYEEAADKLEAAHQPQHQPEEGEGEAQPELQEHKDEEEEGDEFAAGDTVGGNVQIGEYWGVGAT